MFTREGSSMKINFLTTKLSGLTGGVIYDEKFYNELAKYFSGKVSLIEDACFGDEYANVSPNFVRFNKIYVKHAQDILDCDYLFINSRLYTRFFRFPWKINSRCKLILIHHHFDFMTHSGIRRVIHKHLELGFLGKAFCIITPNPYTKDMIRRVNLDNNVELLEAYIDKDIHRPSNDDKKDVISFIGTVEPRKGLHYGIPAFRKFLDHHPSYVFKIAGTIKSNSYTNKLKEIIQDLHLENRVLFLGRVDDAQKVKLYKESKCFLFPSQNEGYGWVIIEAMSYGLPVIAFDNTAMPYTVNNQNGRIVRNRDIDAMAQALDEVIDQPSIYDDLVRGAYKTVQSLPEEDQIVAEYSRFFKEIEV